VPSVQQELRGKDVPNKTRLIAICVALMCATGVGAAVHAESGSAGEACLKRPLRAVIGHGVSPAGPKWYVVSHLKNDADCHTRLLEVSFRPFGRSAASFADGYGVPIGGSLSSTFVISSVQMKVGNELAYAGITSNKVATVEASTGDGHWVKIEPKRPQGPKIPTWLRNVRYFLEYLPPDHKVELVRARDRTGRVLYQGRETVFGEFDDVGVL
jgi:hypothetical protein